MWIGGNEVLNHGFWGFTLDNRRHFTGFSSGWFAYAAIMGVSIREFGAFNGDLGVKNFAHFCEDSDPQLASCIWNFYGLHYIELYTCVYICVCVCILHCSPIFFLGYLEENEEFTVDGCSTTVPQGKVCKDKHGVSGGVRVIKTLGPKGKDYTFDYFMFIYE